VTRGRGSTRSPEATASPLGLRIRSRRRERGLTLMEVARRANLSHPFLSQVERGLAQPSMSSLFRIARALDVTQDWLLAAGAEATATEPVAVLRRGEGSSAPVTGGGQARQLLAAPGRFVPTEFADLGRTFGEFFEHDGSEYVYVIAGTVEVELGDGRRFTLAPGDCLRYPGAVAHRWRAADVRPTRLLMIHTDLAGAPAPDQSSH